MIHDLLLVAAVAAAVIGAVVVLHQPTQWLIDHSPAPIHRAADWLGACDRHP